VSQTEQGKETQRYGRARAEVSAEGGSRITGAFHAGIGVLIEGDGFIRKNREKGNLKWGDLDACPVTGVK